MASRSVNKVILIGHLGKTAETGYTANQIAVTKFSLATNRRFKQGEEWKEAVDWHNVVLWRAEKLAAHKAETERMPAKEYGRRMREDPEFKRLAEGF